MMCCIMFSVTLQPAGGITTTCPSSYVEGVASEVNCTVNLTAFAACINSPTILSYFFTPKGSSTEQFWCSTSIQSCGSTITNASACNNCNCDCLDDSTSTATEYRLIFTPEQQTHAGGNFSCKISCLPPTAIPTPSNVNCAPIGSIMPQSTTQSPTASTNASQTTAQTTSDTTASTKASQTTAQTTSDTTASTTASQTTTKTADKTGDGCLPGCVVGPCVAVFAIIFVIVIGIVVKKKHDRAKCNKRCASPENPQQGQGGQNQNGNNSKPLNATGVQSGTEGGNTNRYTGTDNSPKRPHTTEEKVELRTGPLSTGSPSDEASKSSRPLPTPGKLKPLASGTMPSVEKNSFANPLPPIEK